MWGAVGKFAIKMLATWGVFEALDAGWKKLSQKHSEEDIDKQNIVTESEEACYGVMALIAPLVNNLSSYIPETDPRNAEILLKSALEVAVCPQEQLETRITHADTVCQILGINQLDLTLEELADRLVCLTIEDDPYGLKLTEGFYNPDKTEKGYAKYRADKTKEVLKQLKKVRKDPEKLGLIRRVVAAHELALGGLKVEALQRSSTGGNMSYEHDSEHGSAATGAQPKGGDDNADW